MGAPLVVNVLVSTLVSVCLFEDLRALAGRFCTVQQLQRAAP